MKEDNYFIWNVPIHATLVSLWIIFMPRLSTRLIFSGLWLKHLNWLNVGCNNACVGVIVLLFSNLVDMSLHHFDPWFLQVNICKQPLFDMNVHNFIVEIIQQDSVVMIYAVKKNTKMLLCWDFIACDPAFSILKACIACSAVFVNYFTFLITLHLFLILEMQVNASH